MTWVTSCFTFYFCCRFLFFRRSVGLQTKEEMLGRRVENESGCFVSLKTDKKATPGRKGTEMGLKGKGKGRRKHENL